jgi:hypothetical protein
MGYNGPVTRPLKIGLVRFSLPGAGLLLGILALVGACGGGAGDYCQKVQECEGGNEMDLEACDLSAQADADLAELHNCSSEYEAFFACTEENAHCNNKKYQVDVVATCQQVSEAYNNCVKD